MITLTMRGKCILYAFGYAIAILVGPLILAATIWTVTGNPDLVSCSFWGGLFLGVLAVFTDELRKREALVTQQSQLKQAVTSPSHAPVLTWNAPDRHQVRTETTVDLNVGMLALRVTRCTDVERSTCVPGQYLPAYTPPNQIIKITQD
jgi:hypothetical protein